MLSREQRWGQVSPFPLTFKMLPEQVLPRRLYVEGTERAVDSRAGLPSRKEAEGEGQPQSLLGTRCLIAGSRLTSPTQDVGEAGLAASRQQ